MNKKLSQNFMLWVDHDEKKTDEEKILEGINHCKDVYTTFYEVLCIYMF